MRRRSLLTCFCAIVLAAGCGGRSAAELSAVEAASDQLTPASAAHLPDTGTMCPSGAVHPNLCCSTSALDVTTCQSWELDPLRACPSGTTTNPDPARCCSTDDPPQCASVTNRPDQVPLSSQCNMVCPPGTTYVGPTTPPPPPAYALGAVCSGPNGLDILGPPGPRGPTTGTGADPQADAGPYSAPPFSLCPSCPAGWAPAPANASGDMRDTCCRTPPGESAECISEAYYLPSAEKHTLNCTGPSDYSSCTCNDVSGGHVYAMTCTAAAGGTAACTCKEDGAITKTFTTSSSVLNPYSNGSSQEFVGSNGCGFSFGAPGPSSGGPGP